MAREDGSEEEEVEAGEIDEEIDVLRDTLHVAGCRGLAAADVLSRFEDPDAVTSLTWLGDDTVHVVFAGPGDLLAACAGAPELSADRAVAAGEAPGQGNVWRTLPGAGGAEGKPELRARMAIAADVAAGAGVLDAEALRVAAAVRARERAAPVKGKGVKVGGGKDRKKSALRVVGLTGAGKKGGGRTGGVGAGAKGRGLAAAARQARRVGAIARALGQADVMGAAADDEDGADGDDDDDDDEGMEDDDDGTDGELAAPTPHPRPAAGAGGRQLQAYDDLFGGASAAGDLSGADPAGGKRAAGGFAVPLDEVALPSAVVRARTDGERAAEAARAAAAAGLAGPSVQAFVHGNGGHKGTAGSERRSRGLGGGVDLRALRLSKAPILALRTGEDPDPEPARRALATTGDLSGRPRTVQGENAPVRRRGRGFTGAGGATSGLLGYRG